MIHKLAAPIVDVPNLPLEELYEILKVPKLPVDTTDLPCPKLLALLEDFAYRVRVHTGRPAKPNILNPQINYDHVDFNRSEPRKIYDDPKCADGFNRYNFDYANGKRITTHARFPNGRYSITETMVGDKFVTEKIEVEEFRGYMRMTTIGVDPEHGDRLLVEMRQNRNGIEDVSSVSFSPDQIDAQIETRGGTQFMSTAYCLALRAHMAQEPRENAAPSPFPGLVVRKLT